MLTLLSEYVAAGFCPDRFWTLTPRLFVIHMRAARQRVSLEIEMRNRQSWNTAALTGGAMAGKLKPYEQVFGRPSLSAGKPQSPDVMQAMCNALAKAWGATEEA